MRGACWQAACSRRHCASGVRAAAVAERLLARSRRAAARCCGATSPSSVTPGRSAAAAGPASAARGGAAPAGASRPAARAARRAARRRVIGRSSRSRRGGIVHGNRAAFDRGDALRALLREDARGTQRVTGRARGAPQGAGRQARRGARLPERLPARDGEPRPPRGLPARSTPTRRRSASGPSSPRTAASRAPWSRGARSRDFDVVAFSLSFEDDYPNVLALLDRAGLPLRSADRDERHPLVVGGRHRRADQPRAGGARSSTRSSSARARCSSRPFLAFAREAAGVARAAAGAAARPRRRAAARTSRRSTTSSTPTRARPAAAWVTRFEPRDGAPERVGARYVPDLRGVATSRVVDSPDAQFGDLFLTEVARGCLWGCRFCAAGFVQRPYREVDLETLRGRGAEGDRARPADRARRPGHERPHRARPAHLRHRRGGRDLQPVVAPRRRHHARRWRGGWRRAASAPSRSPRRRAPSGMRRVVNKDFTDDRIVAGRGGRALAGACST